jgi:hypothetical protein
MELAVKVCESLVLSVGTATGHDESVLIVPPERTLFEQLREWLSKQPPPTIGFNYWALGIGATALALRWGTYLAFLMDSSKPVDPHATDRASSMISDSEMKRINIEASSNFAQLLELWHKDEWKFFETLRRAYECLPMPQRRVKRDWQTPGFVHAAFKAAYDLDRADPLAHPELAVAHPYRSLANMIIKLAYRDGPIENVHAGTRAAWSLDYCRFTNRQARQVVRSVAERLSAVMSAYPPWDDEIPELLPWPARVAGLPLILLYPRGWSLTEVSSEIRLQG